MVRRLVAFLFCFVLLSTVAAQTFVPPQFVDVQSGVVRLQIRGVVGQYIPGFGWDRNLNLPAPTVLEHNWVRFDGDVLPDFATAPVLTGVRSSGSGDVRTVFDVSNVDSTILAGVRRSGSVQPGEPLLTVQLPPMLYTGDIEDALRDLGFALTRTPAGLNITYEHPELSFSAFPLEGPQRVVLDITPVRRPVDHNIVEQPSPDVVYQQFVFPTVAGGSVVHAATLDPTRGSLQVVGENRDGKTLPQLAAGSMVAINAGYFDTANFSAIGYLLQNGEVSSYPSRNRAVFAIMPDNEIAIDRVRGKLRVHLPFGETDIPLAENPAVQVVRTAGEMAGRRSMGALQVVGNVVVNNRVGPLEVPENGYVLVYPANNRDIALLDAGDTIFIDLVLDPPGFVYARDAVEAGPLLVKNGVDEFQPELEQFQIGQRILDARTGQAAIGVTRAGQVVMVVAEQMTAAELPELLIALGVVDGLRLDSGGSAAMWLEDGIVNRAGGLRRIQSAIVYYPGTR